MVRSTTHRSSAAGLAVDRRQLIPQLLVARCQPIVLCFAVMDPREVARRDQVVDMYVPQRGTILGQVLTKQSFELTQARHLGAVETEPARYLGEVAPAVSRVHGVAAMGPEFVRFGPRACENALT